jgi:uracil-DNA glycosylase
LFFYFGGILLLKKKKLIDSSKHYVITNIHPSPLAQKKGDFTISKQFSLTNDYLKKHGIKEIDWQIE